MHGTADPDRVRPGTGTRRRPISDHWDGERFFNPHARGRASFADFLRWRREPQRAVWPRRVRDPAFPPPSHVAAGRIAATFIGHSTFLLQAGGIAFLTDPIWSERASPVRFAGPQRARAPGQRLDALPRVDVLLVTHNHYDHLDLPTLRKVRRRWAPVTVTGLGNARHLAKAGIADAVELDWWQETTAADARITYVPAQHFSARTPFDRNRSLWGGFVIQAGGATVYFAGDTGEAPHFAEISQRFPGIDLALLPIGAYAPRWFMRTQHIDPGEAVRAHGTLGARRSIGMHFGTFQLTDEAIDAPVTALRDARRAAGITEAAFDVLGFGETRSFAMD